MQGKNCWRRLRRQARAWFHPVTSGEATTGTVHEADNPDSPNHPLHRPGLYEVYSVVIPRSGPGEEVGTILVDSGSDTNYVRHDFAQRLGLTGTPYACFLKVVDMEYVQKKTARYKLKIVDRSRVEHCIKALYHHIARGTGSQPPTPHCARIATGNPAVNILLGLGSSTLHGRTNQEWGDLRLLESNFGCGWVLRGCHDLLTFPPTALRPQLSTEAMTMSRAVNAPPDKFHIFHTSTELNPAAEFTKLNELGSTPAPVCTQCAGCDNCTFRQKRLSPADQEVVARIEAEMKIYLVTGIITGRYPWKACVNRMVDNSCQALKVQASIEKHMVKAGTHSHYMAEMKKALDESKVCELSESEMSMWHGPTHYISMFAVVKPDSILIRTRIVSNSAMVNVFLKLSLNQCMWPGPNVLANLLDCLLFWRGIAVVIMMDIRKAYQAIHMSDNKLHLRRFFHRAAVGDSWKTLAYTRATFGDVAAGLMLEIAKRKVAVLGESIDPMVSSQLKELLYVDDGILGGSQEEVQRMRGERVDGKYTVAQILAKAGMSVKFMAVTGSNDQYEKDQLASKNLGISYDIKADEILFELKPCYYSGKPQCLDVEKEVVLLSMEDVDNLTGGKRHFTR